MYHLQQVFDRLREHNLKMRKSKCEFFRDSIKYLGFIVDKHGVKPDSAKVEALQRLPTPTTVREVRSFLGMTGYFRRFCPWYSKTALPLTNLTRKNVKFAWTQDCELAFRTLIDQLSNPPVLAHPQVNKPYIVYTDASKNCVGAMLTQEFPEGERPIYFLSHKLSPTQRNWPAVQAETYAIYFAMQKFRPFLYGAPKITVRTDHRPLQYLFTAELVNPSIQRWAIYMSEFNIEIEHISGKDNLCGDFLSRINWKAQSVDSNDSKNVSNLCVSCSNALSSNLKPSRMHKRKEVFAINLDEVDNSVDGKNLANKYTSLIRSRKDDNDKVEPMELTVLDMDEVKVAEEQRNDPVQSQIIHKLVNNEASDSEKEKYIMLKDLLYYISKEGSPTLKLMVPLKFNL